MASDVVPAYARVVRHVTDCTGLGFPANRRSFVEAGVARAIARTRPASVDQYLDLLKSSNAVLDDLVAELTVNETYFFRDPAHFEFIRRDALPEIRQRRGSAHVIYVWSAGCATGEEAYSLAILLEQERLAASSRILATDISRRALAKAQEGVYGEWSLRHPEPGLRELYFRSQGSRFVISDRIKRLVAFHFLNLADDSDSCRVLGDAKMDLILCRNVLIYLEPERIRSVARRLFAALADGGWLITGPSDPLLSNHAPFEVVLTAAGVFYRRGMAQGLQQVNTLFSDRAPDSAARAPSAAWEAPDNLLTRPARDGLAVDESTKPAMPSRDDPDSDELRVLSLANLGLANDAERVARKAAVDKPLLAERHLLHAITLLSLQRYADAAAAAKRAVYLKPDLAVAHVILGTILHRGGAIEGARRALRNGQRLASACPGQEVLPWSGGEPAGRIAAAAAAQLTLLDELRVLP